MDPARELDALGWCSATLAKIEFLPATAMHTIHELILSEPVDVAVRVEVLGFHPVVAPSLAEAVERLQSVIDARDEALHARQLARQEPQDRWRWDPYDPTTPGGRWVRIDPNDAIPPSTKEPDSSQRKDPPA